MKIFFLEIGIAIAVAGLLLAVFGTIVIQVRCNSLCGGPVFDHTWNIIGIFVLIAGLSVASLSTLTAVRKK